MKYVQSLQWSHQESFIDRSKHLSVQISNTNTMKRCKICLKLTIKTDVNKLTGVLLSLVIFYTFFGVSIVVFEDAFVS